MPSSLESPSPDLLADLDGFRVELDRARERADIVLDRPPLNVVSMRQRDQLRAVVEAHRGLTEEQSADFDAALVLILANHIGDIDVLREAIGLAKRRMIDGQQQQQQQ